MANGEPQSTLRALSTASTPWLCGRANLKRVLQYEYSVWSGFTTPIMCVEVAVVLCEMTVVSLSKKD